MYNHPPQMISLHWCSGGAWEIKEFWELYWLWHSYC